MDWKTVDREMTPWRKKIKCLQTKRGFGGQTEIEASEGCFRCEHWESCYESISRKWNKDEVVKGEWTYVGRQYGEASVNGKKAKVLFVSMNRIWHKNRLKRGEDFEYTQKEFRCSALKRSNPHMGGVDVELKYLLDEETSCEDRCQQFALTNAVRCCLPSGSRYRATKKMEKNCAHHTKAIIQALEPDIIIAQGNPPRDSMCKLFDLGNKEKYHNGRPGRSSRSVEICQGKIGDKKVLFLLTAHPARYPGFSWKKGHLPDELKKAFDLAKESI